MNRNISVAAFVLGLIAVCWVGLGYIGSSLLALTMTLFIGVVYVTGALELRRFHQATVSLARALAELPADLPHLGDWLTTLHPSLQNAVRLRIEGERAGLPGPALTPYLVGLLVLLGMLGTFLGMVVTLNGAVIALESSTDLHTIRAALAAPVKGLGLAFGTSVAGVAASAMLGLISALCRGHRQQTGQLLDNRIATVLRDFSLSHQRRETYKALQSQAQALPAVVDQLQAMMAQMDRQSQQLQERLLANQEGHYREARGIYVDLAASVDLSLKNSLSQSARLAADSIQPVVQATMAGIARESATLHEKMAGTLQTQADVLAQRVKTSVDHVADTWSEAMARHQRSGESLNQGLQNALVAFSDTFEQRSAALLTTVAHSQSTLQSELATTLSGMAAQTSALQTGLTQALEEKLDGLSARLNSSVSSVSHSWSQAVAQQERHNEQLNHGLNQSLQAFASIFEQGSAALLSSLSQAQLAAQAESAAREQQRLTAMGQTLDALAASLQQEWRAAGAQSLAQQQSLCAALEQTTGAMAAQAQAQAEHTLNEVARLMASAAEAPKAAAEVIGQLRQELSNSIARDNAALEERSRIMATLAALLQAINHASTEQRGAIDSLVTAAATLLDRAGAQFEARITAETAQMGQVAAQISSGAVEVASLSEAFSLAVQLFSDSNEKLVLNMQRIEAALGKSLSRSDEQLAYYVAQAREIIDLSIMSQKQIVEDMQQLSGKSLAGPGEA